MSCERARYAKSEGCAACVCVRDRTSAKHVGAKVAKGVRSNPREDAAEQREGAPWPV